MNGCDDQVYAVTLMVNHTYIVTAPDEEEARKEALKLMSEGLKAKAVWPVGSEVTAMGKSRDELVDKAIATLEGKG